MTESPPPIDYASAGTTGPVRDNRFGKGVFGWVLFIGLAIMLFVMLKQQQTSRSEISLSELSDLLETGKVKLVSVGPDELRGELNTPGPSGFRVPLTPGMGSNWSFVQWLLDHRGSAEIQCSNSQNLMQIFLPFLPWLFIFLFVWFFILRQLRRQPAKPAAPVPVVIVNPET